MIIEGIVIILASFFMVPFSWLNLPNFPEQVEHSVESYMDLIFSNLDFLSFFIRPGTAQFIITSVIALYTFKLGYDVLMWILTKIPVFGVNR